MTWCTPGAATTPSAPTAVTTSSPPTTRLSRRAPTGWTPAPGVIRSTPATPTPPERAPDDQVLGGADADFIFTGNGYDAIDAGEGANVICSNGGNDVLDSGAGADLIIAGDGDDDVDSGDGADFVLGGSGANTVITDAEDDRVITGSGDDTVDCATGALDASFDAGGTDTISNCEVAQELGESAICVWKYVVASGFPAPGPFAFHVEGPFEPDRIDPRRQGGRRRPARASQAGRTRSPRARPRATPPSSIASTCSRRSSKWPWRARSGAPPTPSRSAGRPTTRRRSTTTRTASSTTWGR